MTADGEDPGPERPPLSSAGEQTLLELALRAITTQLGGDEAATVDARDFPPELRPRRATFVTLRANGVLRGCVGSLEADAPLVENVWLNARRAAFHDPRFAPLSSPEFADVDIHIAILSPRERIEAHSERELLAQLRPGIDGLVIEDGTRRATFLPAVWDSLPRPTEFLRELKLKAGLSATHWSDDLVAWRYATHSFPE